MKRILLTCAFLLSAGAAFPITFNIGLDGVRDANGLFVPMSTLALVVVDTSGNGFGSTVQAGSSAAVGATFGGADDLIVWRGDFGGGGAGAFFDAVSFTTGTASIPANRAMQFVWLPTLTLASSHITGAAAYGTYTSLDATQFGSTATWTTGAADFAVYTLNAFSENNTELVADNVEFPVRLADSVLTASASAVPEPATYAAWFGACSLGILAFVRRRRHLR